VQQVLSTPEERETEQMSAKMTTKHDSGDFVIEEHNGQTFGEFRFSLDRRERDGEVTRLVNIGWYRTYRGALNALSMEAGHL